jgi:carboxyl-terminal processing protease
MPKVLDDDSKFFTSFDEANGVDIKNKRTFGARVENNVIKVKIVAFNKQTLSELTNVIKENEQAEALILDLRGCAGGMSSEAILVADLFLDGGIICSISGKNENEAVYYNAKEDALWKNKPIFIIVDENTASAAEILTASLKEQGIAKVIGTLTKGKGTMQKLIRLETGSVLAITNSMFYTPANNEINKRGITPDICTFEEKNDSNIDKLIKPGYSYCYGESRENSDLEHKIILKMLKKDN